MMYIELLTTVAVVQQDLANAYVASGRMREIGLYFLTLTHATLALLEQVEPPKGGKNLHEAFLKWQKLGMDTLIEEIENGKPMNSEKANQFVNASKQFADALVLFSNDIKLNQTP